METLNNEEINEVFRSELKILPKKLTSVHDLASQFKAMLGSEEAGLDKGVVYCYLSTEPVKTKKSKTRILYLGKTKDSIKQRYFHLAHKLSSGNNADFYSYMIEKHGDIKMGYICSNAPETEEKACFSRYRKLHGQMPPKSKRG